MSERIQNIDHREVVEYNGKKFRSSLEIQTAKVLDSLGIPYLYEERKIILQDKFRSPHQKDMVRQLTYTPDFIIGPIMLECKGFETPEWKIKKKLLFKWLLDNEPDTYFYQVHDAKKSLLEVLDKHWALLGYAVRVTSKPTKKIPAESKLYDSVAQAHEELGIFNTLGAVMSSLTGKREYVQGYNYKLQKLEL